VTDQELAERAGIPLRILLAIRQVESSGTVSAVRFEPHVFWRIRKGLSRSLTGGQIRDSLTAAERAAVPYTPCSADWRAANGLPPCMRGREVYVQAASLVGSETSRSAFERAFRVNPAAAVEATSWGAYQVLGGHLLSTQGGTPAQAVAAFDRDPAGVGRAMLISWFADSAEARALAQRGEVEALARLYNGSEAWGRALRRALGQLPADLPTFSTAANSSPSWVGPVLGGLAFIAVAGGVWLWRR
jgi:hypothetical protein